MNTNVGLAKCHCRHCNGHIAFDPAQFSAQGGSAAGSLGPTVTCPHCGMDTIVFLPRVEKQKPPVAPPQETPPRVPFKVRLSIAGPLIMFLLGLLLVVLGCSSELLSQSAMQQTVCAIQYCTGFLLIGVAFLLDALRSITRNQ